MSPEEVEARPPQRGNLHGSRPPGKFPSKSPQLSMVPSPHGPSPLRHGSTPGLPGALRYTSTPGLPTTTPSSSASFSVVVEPLTSAFARQGFGSPYTTVKNRGRPFQNPPTTPGQPIAKKQGPPFRTPKTAAAAASRAAHDESTVRPPKKPARPFKYPQKPRKVAAVVPPEPKFVLFVCEWKNCPAELHNLDTLQAHLITVHLKNQSSVGRLMCLWRKCSQLSYMAVNDRRALEATDRGVKFETKEEWLNHVRTHLDHVARYQGDGPKTELSFTERQSPALSYSFTHGGPEGQATPSVRNQPIEEGRAKDNNMARFRKKRDGLYIVLEPVDNPELYMKIDDDR